MNKKLLALISTTLAILLAGPILADDEEDDLEVTMEIIENLEQVSEFITLIGQVEFPDDHASDALRQRDGESRHHEDRFHEYDFVDYDFFDEIDERDDSDEMDELDLREEEEHDAPEEPESGVSIHDDDMIDDEHINENDAQDR